MKGVPALASWTHIWDSQNMLSDPIVYSQFADFFDLIFDVRFYREQHIFQSLKRERTARAYHLGQREGVGIDMFDQK